MALIVNILLSLAMLDICMVLYSYGLKILLMATSVYDTVTSLDTTERGAKNGDVEEKGN